VGGTNGFREADLHHPTASKEHGEFLRSIQNVLPCESCREHMAAHMRANPPDEALRAGKDALFAWSVDLHNVVNRAPGKETVDARVVCARLLPETVERRRLRLRRCSALVGPCREKHKIAAL
jgi:hypothetical protein